MRMVMGPLYQQVLERAAAKREARKIVRKGRSLRRQTAFLASIERERWYRERQGVAPL